MPAQAKLVFEHPPALLDLVHVIAISVLLVRFLLCGDHGCLLDVTHLTVWRSGNALLLATMQL